MVANISPMNRVENSNAQHDEAFMSLLSSQRELLNRLTMENAMRRNEAMNATMPVSIGSQYQDLTNRAIVGDPRPLVGFGRRSSIDMLLSKRFSLGFGMNFDGGYSLPFFPMEGGLDYGDGAPSKKRDKLDDFSERSIRRVKRRLSSLGFISPSFFEDNLKEGRRDSLLLAEPDMTKSEEEDDGNVETVVVDGDASDSEAEDNEDEDEVADLTPEPLELNDKVTKVEPKEIRGIMEAFNKAMERSQKSQQDIHDWDRKMGLKRSHSKTMRLSSRSRKKLRASLKKEINALTAK